MKCPKCRSEDIITLDFINKKCNACKYEFSFTKFNIDVPKIDKSLIKMNAEAIQMNNRIKLFTKPIFETRKKIIESSWILKENLSPFVDSFRQISFDFAKKVNELREHLKEHESNTEKYLLLMQVVGYPPDTNLGFSRTKLLSEIYIKYETEEWDSATVISTVNNIMEEIYDEEAITTFSLNWHDSCYSFLDDRIMLLRQALTAHNLGLYALSVPTLITQLEGILASTFKIDSYLSQKNLKKLIEFIFKGENRQEKDLKDFYLNQVLAHFEHGKDIEFDVQRHAILHGASLPTQFANKETSLKIILLLKSMVDEIMWLDEEQIEEGRKLIGK
ncbi:hypothetical protein [Alkalicoccobacillus gibsonii]|uniref:hypothetical protein n=1 Tax=Alkalicoccobacillus gibsonii TaxID=79881 RepID=UPI001934146F|nr:hypothetical protein [Alkalicoccobacillus gibsonii]MBM0064796.1 hypothetical protein [Alkalicoccobacillus gibsonii]